MSLWYLILILKGPTTSAPLPHVAGPITSAPLPPTAGILTASTSPSHMESGSAPPPSKPVHVDDETSHHEGDGSYNEMMRGVWINEEYEAQLKRPHKFQQLFDQTYKKKGTDDYISQKAREVAESYSRGMDERYGDDSQCPELDPDIWVAASRAPKKGHVYGFGHSLGMARVISSCSSSVSHVTSPFTTPTAPGCSSSVAQTMTPAQFRKIFNETISQNISTIVSQTISQTLAQLGILGDRAPTA
ncbi:hypothetical protein Taro_017553 [Colocasia esculenta]|uniref:Uncharacterized protein n=1 Tax=Colocasia esculenta TaxID=4460 RepID=A0A843UZR1_COLES|nr:hypothetical protein [Colocasia esculenta]